MHIRPLDVARSKDHFGILILNSTGERLSGATIRGIGCLIAEVEYLRWAIAVGFILNSIWNYNLIWSSLFSWVFTGL